MKVTAKTITNAQIARMRTLDHHASPLWLREYQIALGEIRTVNDPEGDLERARERLAERCNILNLQ